MSYKHPLEAVADFYEESVAEADKKGYAEIYKAITEQILYRSIPQVLIEDDECTFTVTEIEYFKGYFLVGKGTNSVVQFKIKENPEWLFGIWYSLKEDELCNDLPTITVEMFAQYEEEIDKFKPSASVFQNTICTNSRLENLDDYALWDFARQIRFIIKEPALAYCRDVYHWDYNEEYHTREEAERTMAEDVERKDRRQSFKEYAENALLNYIKNFWKGETVFIHDFGECISPRYEVTFLYEDQEDDTRPINERIDGMHYLSYIESQENEPSDFPDDIKMYQFFRGYHELKTRLEKESDEYDFYWWPDVGSFFYFQSMSNYEAWKQRVKDLTGENIEDKLIYC